MSPAAERTGGWKRQKKKKNHSERNTGEEHATGAHFCQIISFAVRLGFHYRHFDVVVTEKCPTIWKKAWS